MSGPLGFFEKKTWNKTLEMRLDKKKKSMNVPKLSHFLNNGKQKLLFMISQLGWCNSPQAVENQPVEIAPC